MESEGVSRITVLQNGLIFYWLGRVDNNMHYVIDQEFNPRFPHCYTTPPVLLMPQSLVLDVGACEGLFAYRVAQAQTAAKIICFEPSEKTARYTRLGAEKNGLTEKILVETLAVGKSSGRVSILPSSESPDAHRVSASAPTGKLIDCVSLDDYCATKNLRLTSRDLIKIDAEGSDFDVLLGAENLIRRGSPQIAVTTYHEPEHVFQIVDYLKKIQPAYRLRLKGFSSWTTEPQPVLLQAAL